MPEVSARSRSSESARIRLPSSVIRSISPVATRVAKPTTITISWVRPIRRPRKSTVSVLLTSSWRSSVPQTNWIP